MYTYTYTTYVYSYLLQLTVSREVTAHKHACVLSLQYSKRE